ncbi:hypothetical protein DPMN_135620 [Dreissena polymorpha]|uniref:Uncharacterized protein n=1 Tax=Dreissena polymorpha TaxID=45954 RepID=A0A9D4G296_DREPO|nr:hypothetical protein DPMN_135620 [Dreissena polymorpha]
MIRPSPHAIYPTIGSAPQSYRISETENRIYLERLIDMELDSKLPINKFRFTTINNDCDVITQTKGQICVVS